jgi:hypothetical protein
VPVEMSTFCAIVPMVTRNWSSEYVLCYCAYGHEELEDLGYKELETMIYKELWKLWAIVLMDTRN